jgi:hypothetical protein
MTTENTFTETAKTLQENFANGMKWTEDANKNLMEKQLKASTEIFNKVLSTSQMDGTSLTNEMKKQIETINQQVADLTQLNKTNLEAVLKQFETTTKSFTPLSEQLKKEIEKVVESSKETNKSILYSYSTFTAPSIEAVKENFEKLNERIKTSIEVNVKFWNDLMNPVSSTSSATKTAETKVDNEFIKMSANSIAKKTVTV